MVRLEEELKTSVKATTQDLEDNLVFAKKVLKKMADDNIAPTPYNFQIYFDALLDESPSDFKQKIDSIRQSESINNDEQRAKMEKNIKDGFTVVKNMVQSFTTTYKNMTLMKAVMKKRADNLEHANSQLTAKNIIKTLAEDMDKFDTLMSKQLSSLKTNYEQAIGSLKSIEQESIYDTRYSLYNKKYLLQAIKNEKNSIATQGHASSLMLLKIKDSILSKIPYNKDRIILSKNIAKLLQKTSRRSDIISHYGDGIFAMLMKHTNIDSAKNACERISNLVYSSSFFIGGMDINMDIEIAVLAMTNETSIEEDLAGLLDTLPKSSKSKAPYVVAVIE